MATCESCIEYRIGTENNIPLDNFIFFALSTSSFSSSRLSSSRSMVDDEDDSLATINEKMAVKCGGETIYV
jgi:hypothetical protein